MWKVALGARAVIASKYFGIGGPCDFDKYGDRAYVQYDYWEYCLVDEVVEARKCGTYDWGGVQIKWIK
jgi:hypothetical protein